MIMIMIDIQTLTIGSHVMFNGERVEVIAIDTNFDEDVPVVVNVHEVIASGEYDITCDPVELDPIPITEELLTDLGFEKLEEDDKNKKSFFHSNIKLGLMLFSDGQCYVSNLPNSIIVRYLHELESFVYLTTKQRLI